MLTQSKVASATASIPMLAVLLWVNLLAADAPPPTPAPTPAVTSAPAADPAKPVVTTAAADVVKKETWDYVASSKEILKKFTGKEGVVVHFGDSITCANPYGQWARYGKGQTEVDKAILKWMHCGAGNDTDGWYLAAKDMPGGRTCTASGGMTSQQFIEGGHGGLPKLDDLIKTYNPQMVVLMLGTNDASQKRTADDFIKDMTTIIEKLHANGTVVILSSVSPYIFNPKIVEGYNERLYQLAKEKKMPYLDYYGAILKLEPGTGWDGTIITKHDAHPTANNASAEPTDENFKLSGYLLRGWLSVQKIREVKEAVIGK